MATVCAVLAGHPGQCVLLRWYWNPLQRSRSKSLIVAVMVAMSQVGCVTTVPHDIDIPERLDDTDSRAVEILAALENAVDEPPDTETFRRVTVDGLVLSDAVGLAISRHPEIGRQNAVIVRSASEIEIAKSAWYPTLEYGFQPGHGARSVGNNSLSARSSIGVNQVLYDFGRIGHRVSAARATLAQQEYLREDTIAVVAYDTAVTFVALAAHQDVIAAAQKQLRALQETRSRIAERVGAGLSNTSDLNQADVALQRAQADALKVQTEYEVAAGALEELIGIRPRKVAALLTTANVVSGLGSGNMDIEQAPAVFAAYEALRAAAARVKLAAAEHYPSISMGVVRNLSTSQRNHAEATYIGLTLKGSFSFGGQVKQQVVAAEAERMAALKTLENEKLLVRTALHSAETEASGAAARLANYDRVIDLSRSSRDLFWQEYTLDKRSLTDVINVEREIYSAEVERIHALTDSVNARIKAYTSTGQFVSLLHDVERGLAHE